MFSKIKKTIYPPTKKPILVWDGECGFCKYWVTRWKSKTGTSIEYVTYQNIANNFPDIPIKEFKKASRLIDLEGNIYSGPDSAYKSYTYSSGSSLPWHSYYNKYSWFTWLSDHLYNFIAKNRATFYTITKILFGNNPEKLKYYWVIYIILIFSLIFTIVWIL